MPETEAEQEPGRDDGGPETVRAESSASTGRVPSSPAGEALDAALAELRSGNRAAAQLLGVLSFLAEEPVPFWLPAGQADALPDPLGERARAGEEAVSLAARELSELGLAATGGSAVRVPAAVASAVRERMSVRERGAYVGAAVSLLFRAFPDRVGRADAQRRCRTLAPHVLAVSEHPRGGGRATAEAVHTLARLGAFHRSDGDPDRAEAAFRRALEVSDRGAPVEGPLRAVLADELSSVLAGRGRAAEAAETAGRAVELAREGLTADSPQLPLLLSNAATTFREVGELDRAARCFEEALDCAPDAGAEAARPLVAELLAGLADVEMARGRWDDAADAARRALAAAEEAWGRVHPETVRAAWMLGDARREQGRDEEASRLFRRALAAEEELHGPGHPAVGQKAMGLARHLEASGRPGEAADAYTRAAEAFEAALGPDSDAARAARAHREELEAGG